MNKIGIAVALLAGLVRAGIADDFDKKVAVIYLLQSKPVQTELKITAAQRKTMNDASKPFNDKSKAIMEASKGRPTAAQQKQINDALTKLRTTILGQLSASQLTRLRQLSLQAIGVGALGDDVVAAKLGLNSTQVTNIRKELNSGMTKVQNAQKSFHERAIKGIKEPKTDAERKTAAQTYEAHVKAMTGEINSTMAKIKTSTESKVLAILTGSQRTAWTNLLGKRFTG